jgi:hypothetical protein
VRSHGLRGDEQALEASLGHTCERLDGENLVSNDLLEPTLFVFQLAQATQVAHLKPPYFARQVYNVVSLMLKLATDIGGLGARVAPFEDRNDLGFGEA